MEDGYKFLYRNNKLLLEILLISLQEYVNPNKIMNIRSLSLRLSGEAIWQGPGEYSDRRSDKVAGCMGARMDGKTDWTRWLKSQCFWLAFESDVYLDSALQYYYTNRLFRGFFLFLSRQIPRWYLQLGHDHFHVLPSSLFTITLQFSVRGVRNLQTACVVKP
jgi:hypothetical protein